AVQLNLSEDRIPGLKATPKEGTYRGEISSEGSLVLFATNLQFADSSPRTGEISLSVDGCERAILRDADFGPKVGGTPSTLQKMDAKPRIRAMAPKAAVPGKPCPVRLEVDFPPDETDKLVLRFGNQAGEQFEPIKTYEFA